MAGWRFHPTRGSSDGLRPSQDPEITLYKIGYQVTTLINRVEQDVQYDRARNFAQDGQTFAVGVFRGNLDEREKQLFKGWKLTVFRPSRRQPAASHGLIAIFLAGELAQA
jgi:hypothetical protein